MNNRKPTEAEARMLGLVGRYGMTWNALSVRTDVRLRCREYGWLVTVTKPGQTGHPCYALTDAGRAALEGMG